jgi:hypothetical protein
MSKSRLYPTVALLLLLLSGVLLFYHQVIFAPNTTFMGGSQDAQKNYYTPWYHAKFDSSFTWFQGMNYPYGEHLVFADGQPLLSNTVKVLGLADQTVGTINLALILSLFPAAWLLFRILLRWKMNDWYAVIAAVAITMLSPQLLKFNGHFALGYTFAVPLIWHLALRWWERPSVQRSLHLTAAVFLLGWLHPYYVMISAIFLTAFWLFYTLLEWKRLPLLQKGLHFGLQVILPVLLFFLALKLTDPVTDRPSNPYGFDEYYATWRTVFFPYAIVWLEKIVRGFQTEGEQNWEGIAYVGLIGGLSFVGFWISGIVRFFKGLFRGGLRLQGLRGKMRQGHFIGGVEDDRLRNMITVSVLAGLVVGIFSCGFPFAIKPELMTDIFPPIKQFRSLGRFSWAFYYVWMTFSFFLLWQVYQWLVRKQLRVVGISLLVVMAGWTIFEGIGLNEGVRRRTSFVKREFLKSDAPGMVPGYAASPWIAKILPEKYSAFVVLPYFHIGSENFRSNEPAAHAAFETSLRTGLPMTDVMMSRTSFSQTWAQMQVATEPAVPLEILRHFKDPRPLLALRFAHASEFDGPYLQRYGEPIYAEGGIEFYEIDLAARQKELLAIAPVIPDSLIEVEPSLWLTKADTNLFFTDFETTGEGQGYRSSKGKTVKLNENNIIFEQHFNCKPMDTFIVSIWVKLRSDVLPHAAMGWEQIDSTFEGKGWDYLSFNAYIKRFEGEWALCEREVVVKDPAYNLKVNVTRWRRKPPLLTVDNLLIRPKGIDVYRIENGKLVWRNNRYFE